MAKTLMLLCDIMSLGSGKGILRKRRLSVTELVV